jgi:mannitol/fructose-specific phosphotransferase system IIA component (Ntr-type)
MTHLLSVAEFLDTADIHVRFSAPSIDEAIPLLLLRPLAKECGGDAEAQRVIDAIVQREREGSTVCGSLALPHTRSSAVKSFVLSLGINAAGVIEGQAEPRLIIAFVSPEAKREDHLRLLATLARLSQNPAVVDQLTSATSAEQVEQILEVVGA